VASAYIPTAFAHIARGSRLASNGGGPCAWCRDRRSLTWHPLPESLGGGTICRACRTVQLHMTLYDPDRIAEESEPRGRDPGPRLCRECAAPAKPRHLFCEACRRHPPRNPRGPWMTPEVVLLIREEHALGAPTRVLAQRHGCSIRNVRKIVSGATWRNLVPPRSEGRAGG
jgi:hypothetical protein